MPGKHPFVLVATFDTLAVAAVASDKLAIAVADKLVAAADKLVAVVDKLVAVDCMAMDNIVAVATVVENNIVVVVAGDSIVGVVVGGVLTIGFEQLVADRVFVVF